MAETGSEARSGIGARLRAGREKIGLTQLQAAEKLHVDAKVIDSLEVEHFDALGAPVFVRGHLKHYAELIGEQPGELVDLYVNATKAALPDLTKLPKVTRRANPSRLAVPALVVLIGFVLLGVVWWVVKSVTGPEGAKPTRGAQPVTISPEVAPDPATEGVANEIAPTTNGAPVSNDTAATRIVTPHGGTAAAASAGARGSSVAPNAGAGGAASSAGGRAASATLNGAASATANGSPGPGATSPANSGAATAPTTPARGKAMEVTLRFAADSWVEVYDADGEKLFYDVGSADSSRTVSGTPPFRVTVANAPGVSLDVNGKPAPVPPNAVKGDEAHFVINRAGRIVRATPKADGG